MTDLNKQKYAIRRRYLRLCLAGLFIFGIALPIRAQNQPYVVGSYPRDGESGLLRNLFVSLKINLPNSGLDVTTLTKENIRLYPSGSPLTLVDVWLMSDDELKNIAIQPKEILAPNTGYTLEVLQGLQDQSGLPFKSYRVTFRTGAIGLDKPGTVPPGYSDMRDFAFPAQEETQDVETEKPMHTPEEIAEIERLLEEEPDDEDGGLLIDISDLMAENEEVEEISTYRPDEEDPDDADLMVEFEEDSHEERHVLDKYGEETIAEKPDVPEVILTAESKTSSTEEGSDDGIPDLVDIDDPNLIAETEAEEEVATSDFKEIIAGPEPKMGYLMPLEKYSSSGPADRTPEPEAETRFGNFEAAFKPEGFVELRWDMVMEFKNNYFSVERSTDGQSFQVVDTLHSRSKKKEGLNYLRTDDEAPIGINYYRIGFKTQTGSKGYTGIQKVVVKEKEHIRFAKTAIFPNARLPLEFKLNEPRRVQVLITTLKGKPVKKISGPINAGKTIKAINMQGVPSGTYIALIEAGELKRTREITVLR